MEQRPWQAGQWVVQQWQQQLQVEDEVGGQAAAPCPCLQRDPDLPFLFLLGQRQGHEQERGRPAGRGEPRASPLCPLSLPGASLPAAPRTFPHLEMMGRHMALRDWLRQEVLVLRWAQWVV